MKIDVSLRQTAAFAGSITSRNFYFVNGSYAVTDATLYRAADFQRGTFKLTWKGGDITLSGQTFVNNGTIDASADGRINAGASSLTNACTIVESASAGAIIILDKVGLTNTGLIGVRGGTIALPTNPTNDGTLAGTGSFRLSGTLTNKGIMAPGNGGTDISSLIVEGNYCQTAAGILGIQSGGGYADPLTIRGAASLDGTLALSGNEARSRSAKVYISCAPTIS